MEPEINQMHMQAIFAHQNRRYADAENIYRQILSAHPEHADANHNLGLITVSNGKHLEALGLFESAIQINPDCEQFWLSYITALNSAGNFPKADRAFKKAKKAGISKKTLKTLKSKLLSDRRNPDPISKLRIDKLEEELMNLLRTNSFKDAEILANSIIQAFPERIFSWKVLGGLFNSFGKKAESLDAFKRATEINPDDPEAQRNLAALFWDTKKLPEALQAYECALSLDSYQEDVLGWVIYCKQELGYWKDIFENIEDLKKAVYEGRRVAHPFVLNAIVDSTEIVSKATQLFMQKKYPKSKTLPPIDRFEIHDKIRIGYYSPDFREHPVAKGIVDLFKNHDRQKFEIYAFSLGDIVKDKWNLRVREGVDFFHELQNMTDRDIALLSRDLKIDIAVDLAGLTTKARTSIFAMSVAPIQLSYFGFLGTMGASYYDYVISDPVLIKNECKHFYNEKIICLPSYQVNSSVMEWPNTMFDKKYFNIPEDVIVFGSINMNYKLTSDLFDSWARILFNVKDSVLLLYIHNKTAAGNLENQMRIRNIDPNRLIFAERINGSEYWSRYKSIDLLLDTFNCSGGATSSDALRMGCPVLTCLGDTASSRFGGSLLTALELPELITSSPSEYEDRAIDLATNPSKLESLKEKLLRHLSTKRLFDARQFTASIEKAYVEIYNQHKNDKPPVDVFID